MNSFLIIVIIAEAVLLAVMAFKLCRTKYDGTIDVLDTPEKKTFSMELASDPNDLDQKKQVIFKVHKSTP
jgi:uncharacterized protein (DUF1778 family)